MTIWGSFGAKIEIVFTKLSNSTWKFYSILAQPTINWSFGIGNYHFFS